MKFAIAALALVAGTTNAQLINEFSSNPDGADPATFGFEIKGTPGASFNGTLYSIEGDFAAPNAVDYSFPISGSFDANGLLSLDVPDFENPSFTLILSSGGTAAVGTQYDFATADLAALFGNVFDAVTIIDAPADAAFSVVPFLGTGAVLPWNGPFGGAEPERVFRDGVTNEWYQVYDVVAGTEVLDASGNFIANGLFDSDPNAYNFGGVNQTLVPAPASAALLGLGGIAAIRRRR